MKLQHLKPHACSALFALFVIPQALHAADETWDGDTDALWSVFTNWVSDTGAPGTGDIATFNSAVGTGGASIIDLGAGVTVDQIIMGGTSVTAYTIGAGGAGGNTLTFSDNGNTANFSLTAAADADQTIDANILLGPDAAINDTNFDLDSTTNKLVINGNIDTAAGGTAGVKRLEFGDFNGTDIGEVELNGNVSNTGAASRVDLFVAGADLTMNGTVSGTGNTQRTYIRDGSTATVGTGASFGQGALEVRKGTLNLNTDAQQFDNSLILGDTGNQAGNATVNIGGANTLAMNSGITYEDRTGNADASTATIAGGTLQITGAARTIVVHNNPDVASGSPELTISSDITNDGSDRDLTIRGPDNEAEAGTILLSGTNDHGAITLQAGTLQLGSNAALDTGGDFLTIAARNAGATAPLTSATLDLMGNTNTVNDINIGNDSTANITDNGWQGNIIDTVGGGKLVDANLLRFRNGTGTGIQRNGSATVSADIDFDASGNGKSITIEDGTGAIDLTITGAFNTAAGQADDDFIFLGDGTLSYSGTLGNAGAVGGHDETRFECKKTILGAGVDIQGVRTVYVRQRNNATYSDFDVEFDINGQELVLGDDLIVAGPTTSVTTVSNIRITDSADSASSKIRLTGDNDITYNAGSANDNLMATIEADLQFDGSNFTTAVNNGADDIDLEITGTITDDNSGGRNLSKSGAGTLKLTATDNLYNVLSINAGRAIITDVGALGDNDIQLGNNANNGILEFDLASDQSVLNANQIRVGDDNAAGTRTGTGSIVNNGTGAVTFPNGTFNELRNLATVNRTLTLDGSNTGDNTITGVIRDNGTGGSLVSLTKNGNGTWILNGANTYTGATTVNAGCLEVNGSLSASSAVTVADSACLSGSGIIAGPVTLGTTAGITLNLDGTPGGLAFSSAVDTSLGVTVNIAGPAPGIITVLDYNETLGGSNVINVVDFTLGTAPTSARGAGSFVDDTTKITIDLGFVDNTWQGTDGTNPTFWDIGSTANWTNSVDSVFQEGDNVIFGDSASTFNPTLQANVTVGNATFDSTNTANDYTLDAATTETLTVTGILTVSAGDAATTNGGNDIVISAVIAGAGSLFVGDTNGASDASQNSLQLTAANTYSGGSTLEEGRVSITDSGALSTGTVTLQDTGGAANRDPILDLDMATGFDVTNAFVVRDTGGSKIIRFDNGGTNTGTVSGTILTQETGRNNFRLETGGNETLTVSNVISGAGRVATKGPDNSGVVFGNASNSFTGPIVVGSNVQVASIGDGGVASHAGAGSIIYLGISGGTGATPSNNKRDGNLIYTGAGTSTDRRVQVGNFWFTAGQNHANGGTITNNGTGALTFTNATFSQQESRVAADIGPRTLTLGGAFAGANEIQGAILDNVATDAFVDETVAVAVDTSGTWILSADNSYTGGTTLIAGTLQVGNGGSAGSLGTGAITNDATLDFKRSDALAVSAAISGTGAVVQSGTGTTTLSATNSYSGNTSVTGGILSLGNGASNTSLDDAADVSVATGAVLDLNYAGTDTVDELFLGGVQKSAGTWGATGSGAAFIDDTFFTGTGTLTVSTGTTAAYETWADDNSLVGADRLPSADIESGGTGDGRINLLEFAFGTDPTTSDSGPLAVNSPTDFDPGDPIVPPATFSPLKVVMQFARRKNFAAEGLTYTPLFSSDGMTFIPDPAAPAPDPVSTEPGDYEVVEVPFLIFLPDGTKADAMLGRVRVEMNP